MGQDLGGLRGVGARGRLRQLRMLRRLSRIQPLSAGGRGLDLVFFLFDVVRY